MDLATAARTFSALGHPARLGAVELLAASPDGRQASDIAATLGLSRSLATAHLKTLVAAGLLSFERRGQEVHYRIRGNAVRSVVERLGGMLPA
jgi:DNA-binding transcriptional ArsR family regulator